MGVSLVKCPSCNKESTELEWDNHTEEIVSGLVGDNFTLITYKKRFEGVYFRCPNTECGDEVIVDSDGILKVQDEKGEPII